VQGNLVTLTCFPSIAPKQLGKCEHFLKASDISHHLSSVSSGKNSQSIAN